MQLLNDYAHFFYVASSWFGIFFMLIFFAFVLLIIRMKNEQSRTVATAAVEKKRE